MFLDPRQRTVAIGVWISSYSAGAAIGPLVGGVLLEHFWWGSAFLIGVPVMVLLLILGPMLLPEFKDPNAGKLDPISAAMSLVAVLGVIYGVKQMAQDGVGARAVVSIVIGLVVGLAFVRRQQTLRDPLIDLGLFRSPGFSVSLAVYTIATFVAFGIFVFEGQYLQLVLGLSPLQAGLVTLPFAIAFIVGSMLSPILVRRIAPATLITGGLVIAAFGFAVLARFDAETSLTAIVVVFFLYAIGLAPAVTLTTDLIVGTAPPERAGAAAALSETGSELGGALGIAILGSLGTLVYRRALSASATNLPADAVETARGTLGGALDAARRLPSDVGERLVVAARSSFVDALQMSAVISAVIVLVIAVVAGVLLAMPARRQAEVT
jgi:DHA2 family multidrug resistance protein-like MFS transporter